MGQNLLDLPPELMRFTTADLSFAPGDGHEDFVETAAPAGYEDTERDQLKMDYPKITIKAQAIVNVPTTDGRHTMVCFCPISNVEDVFEQDGQIIKLDIVDGNGEFTRDTPMVLTSVYHDRNIDVLTLELEDLVD